MFGLGSDKEALSAAFEAGTDDNKRNLLFGSSGIVSRTLEHWRDLLDDASRLIESLRAELFKSRAEAQEALLKSRAEAQEALAESRSETQKALNEKEKAEGNAFTLL
jgi:hypothetical protein